MEILLRGELFRMPELVFEKMNWKKEKKKTKTKQNKNINHTNRKICLPRAIHGDSYLFLSQKIFLVEFRNRQ